MSIHLINPSHVSFGIGVITPRWLYVLAQATPARFGDPVITDETLEPLDPAIITRGDIVGIGIHTGNALRGYEIGIEARAAGAIVVFGGIHATLFPEEARDLGGAHAVVKGDGDLAWTHVLDDCAAGRCAPVYEGGQVEPEHLLPARWDLMPSNRYMWASVQTVRGCPKHCSFCSVWKTDGQRPRQRMSDMVVEEVVELRRRGFRFIALADDNFYPVTLTDLQMASRRTDQSQFLTLSAIRTERFELMRRLAALPDDMVFFTQITMEAAEDPEFLDAMSRARIKGALVGVEAVTPEGLKDVHKGFNAAGDQLIDRLRAFRHHGVHVGTKARLLAEQNAEVEQARHALEEKAAELALTSKYKSEFLANMSHELRTPLNSILILSQQLAENASGNLNAKQVEFSRNVNSSGSDLLHLINDILDLSKIESGTVSVDVEEIPFTDLQGNIDRNFRHVAEAKNLPFNVNFSPNLPKAMDSDPKRLQQILKNLLSNAVKFTAHGKVEVRVDVATQGWSPDHPVLGRAAQVIGFAVEDTGIGIAPEKQRLIFEAFQQADAGTSRKYGGTGLGLAISRELAVLLGGEIKLRSIHGQGSTFTLYLPVHYSGPDALRPAPSAGTTLAEAQRTHALTIQPAVRDEHIEDDRNSIEDSDPVVLIIEDDPNYARILLGLARDKGFKGIVAQKGALGLSLARQFHPAAISLDIFLPDMLGWTVLNQLKLDPATRHIPVQIVTLEEERQHGLSHGAFNYLIKAPTTEGLEAAFERIRDFSAPRTKRLLVVEDNAIERASICELLGYEDIEMVTAGSGEEALEALLDRAFDCVVLDLRLPDMTGFELLEKMHAEPELEDVPVVVFTGKDLTTDEQAQIKTMAKSIVLKDVQSPERLLDETALFLHRVVTDLPAEKQSMLEKLHSSKEVLRGRKVLVVDDDARNIFALTSLLENQEMDVISATDGRTAIDFIQHTPDLSLVLMDIMMPEMDGYETMRKIRSVPEFRTLPILALTAKAMKGDREKCLDAGASDYIAKPVNTDQLLSLMRVWLFR